MPSIRGYGQTKQGGVSVARSSSGVETESSSRSPLIWRAFSAPCWGKMRSQFGVHKPIHVELFIPLLHPNKRARPSARPDAPDDWAQTHPMLVHRPSLHLGSRMGLLNLSDPFRELTFERLSLHWISFVVTWPGNLEEKPIRLRYSQPR